MDALEALPSVTRLSERVLRILGQNPGKFTLQGTNTYLVGSQKPYILIDTGEGRDEYIPHLEHALRQTTSSEQSDVSDIIISHWHQDHVGGIPSVLELLRRLWSEKQHGDVPYEPPKLHKFPSPIESNQRAHDTIDLVVKALQRETASPLYTPSPRGEFFHDLVDGQEFPFAAEADSSATNLRVIHTPGHTTDSISLYIPSDEALYTADTVLGQGTAVFEDLSTYIASLRKMLTFRSNESSHTPAYTQLYCGHGPVVVDGPKLIETYIQHRMERENDIVKVLSTRPENDSYWTTWTLVSKIYASYPESLWLPAAHGVDLHLKKLLSEGRVKRIGEAMEGLEAIHTQWELIQ